MQDIGTRARNWGRVVSIAAIAVVAFAYLGSTAALAAGVAPAITSAADGYFHVGVATTFTVTTTGSPAPSITETGSLPAGLTFTDNGDGTATLSGTALSGRRQWSRARRRAGWLHLRRRDHLGQLGHLHRG